MWQDVRIARTLVVAVLAGACGGSGSSAPTAPSPSAASATAPTSEETPSPTQTGNTGITVNGISLSELPATQTMTMMPFDPAAVTYMSPFRPSHTGIDINTITGGRFLSPGTGIVTLIELNTGQGLPGGTNYRVRIHLTSTGLNALYHFEVDGSISDQTQQNNILVALGDRVTAGQHIGNLVSLGKNAHVHFDMLDAGGRDAVQCPLVYFSSVVATTWESLYDAKILERTSKLPDLCNEVDVPNP